MSLRSLLTGFSTKLKDELDKPIKQVKSAVNPYIGNSLANRVVTSKPFQSVGTLQNNIQDFWNNKRDLTSEVDFLSNEISRSKAPKPLKMAGNIGLGQVRTGALALSGGRDVAKGGLKVGQNAMLLRQNNTPQQKEYLRKQLLEGGLQMGGGLLQGAYAQFRQGGFGQATTLAENSAFETLKNIREKKPISDFDFRGSAKDLFLSDALGIRESHPLLGMALDLATNLAIGKGEENVYKAMTNPRHRKAIMKALKDGDKEALIKAFKNLGKYVKDFGKYADSVAKDQRGFVNMGADINIKPDESLSKELYVDKLPDSLQPLARNMVRGKYNKEAFIEEFDKGLKNQNLTRRETAQNIVNELKKYGMTPESFYDKFSNGVLSKELKVGGVNQVPRVTSKGQNQVGGKIPSTQPTQVLPQQPQKPQSVISPKLSTSQKSSVPDQSYGGSIAQTGIKGEKNLFGYQPIKTNAVSAELDEAGKAKLERRAKLDAERAAKNDYDRWYKSQRDSGQIKTTSEQLDIIGKSIEGNTKGVGAKNIEELKDIGNIAKGFNTVKRNFKAVFGKHYDEVDKEILEPFYRSKDLMVRELQSWDKSLKSIGIKKGSKMSKLVQMFGEKKISYEGLKSQVGEVNAKKIVEADKFFRNAYNTLIDDVNKVRARIYPNNPEKIIPKRADYYRHFQEMQEGVAGLKNIFENPAGISSTLAGVSADTKPKSKWLSFAQKREGDKTTYDAVGGFIDYVQKAMYAKHIDPNIENFRNLSTELEQATLEGANKGKLNNFIEYLNDFANDLSGKTGPAERLFQKYVPGGRKAMRGLSWLNNRIKANVILGNLSSSLAQPMNIPQGIASAGPKSSLKGVKRTLASIFNYNNPMRKSRFINERYAEPFKGFDTGLLNRTKDFAKWVVTVLDEAGTKYIWNSHYEKALTEGIQNPIKYADDMTESLVGGRGIGEVPLMQKDKVFQLIAPFQLEVGNLWYVMKGWTDNKQFGKLATFAVVSYLMNRAVKEIRGSDVSFDPINSLVEGFQAFQEEDDKKIGALRFAGRQAGEVLSNVPLGQSVAALYPEYGATLGDTKVPTRKDLFGEGDPTRYGSGLLVAKGLQDPLAKIIPPFGGQQIKRTIEGLSAVAQGEAKTKGGDTQYLIDQNPRNFLQAGAFGKYSVPEAQEYFKENRRPLSAKQSEVVRASSDKKSMYGGIMKTRQQNAAEDKVKEQVKKSGGEGATEDTIFYYNGEDVKSVKKKLTLPKLTSNNELNKKLISRYKSDLTDYTNYIIYQYESGKITEEQAGSALDKVKAINSWLSQKTKTPKKAKTANLGAISQKILKPVSVKPTKVKFNTFEILDEFRKIKAPDLTPPKIEAPKFKKGNK